MRITKVAQSAKRKDPPSEPMLGGPKRMRRTGKVYISHWGVLDFMLTILQENAAFFPTSTKWKDAPTWPIVDRPKCARST
jgi:hypothetical protein